MNKQWDRQGECEEQKLIETIYDDCYSWFVAYQTDKFISGRNTLDALKRIECDRLLEIRIFSEEQEVMARRTMTGFAHSFQWRIASEEGLSEDEYIVRYQTLDIDQTRTAPGLDGNLQLMTTGGGRYELPISEEQDSIRVISYVGYSDEDGMAFIYDNRLAGFVTGGGRNYV